jgi:opacity protein-like surface antigen
VTRKGLLALALILFAGSTAWAQSRVENRAEITAYGGWQFGGVTYVRQGDLNLNDAFNYGVIVDVTVRPGAQVELMYNRQETELRLREPFGVNRVLTDLTVEYWLAGGLMEVERGHAATPFVSLTLGAVHYNPKEREIDGRQISDEWNFAMALGLGVKYFASDRIGLRLQGHFWQGFTGTGGSIFCGGGGCSFGLFGWGPVQGDIAAGLTFAF